jgi:hypothetical protein
MKKPTTVYGVDFSGARLPGRILWVARAEIVEGRLALRSLDPIGRLAGVDDRESCLHKLLELIRGSRRALWGIDFPFALPIEIAPADLSQLDWLAGHPDDATEFGRLCVARAKALGPKMHLRRQTDVETKTPFDAYHYRIIHQLFHGMRSILTPLWHEPKIAVLPFQYDKQAQATALVTEACPGSTLKRLALPHNRYKQTGGRPVTVDQKAVRRRIFAGLASRIDVPPGLRRKAMLDPGGDALDAVIAAAGVYDDYTHADHAAIAAHNRYPREGRIYA